MSMSLRDQLLAAGLVSQKQVREAERQQQHQERSQHQSKQKRRPASQQEHAAKTPGHRVVADVAPGKPAPGNSGANHNVPISGTAARQASAQSAKVARDLALNKKQQEKAQHRARAAQIKQLIEQNRLLRAQSDERYNFVDGGRVRFIAANADIRSGLMAGALSIVRHDGVYEVVPAAIAQRIRERDERSVIQAAIATPAEAAPVEDVYKDFAVPDDLMW